MEKLTLGFVAETGEEVKEAASAAPEADEELYAGLTISLVVKLTVEGVVKGVSAAELLVKALVGSTLSLADVLVGATVAMLLLVNLLG